MSQTLPTLPAESDVRFLEYRLDVISRWPPSGRKQAAAEAISRRLTAIARSTLARPGVDDLMALSCRLLDDVFAEKTAVGDLDDGARSN
jgi:hypothetical protein